LFEAIKMAAEEMGKNVTDTWEQIIEDKDGEQIALYLYYDLVLKKEISKTIIAQHFANILDENQFEHLEEDESLSYLLNAINYAAA
ncbi:MAG: hypothetical protein Q7K29_03375, partial [Thermoleophilia bacterium]|nr:hypothetical protein [Thermoleophilia bacterium]